jgi:hypothetical protein
MADETKEKYSDPSISTNYTLYYISRNNEFKLHRVHTQNFRHKLCKLPPQSWFRVMVGFGTP